MLLSNLPDLHEAKDLYEWANANGLQKTKELFAAYVEIGQPDDFMDHYTSRAMCFWASMGLEGNGFDDTALVMYIDTVYGPELYFHMWGW